MYKDTFVCVCVSAFFLYHQHINLHSLALFCTVHFTLVQTLRVNGFAAQCTCKLIIVNKLPLPLGLLARDELLSYLRLVIRAQSRCTLLYHTHD